eukprot:5642004-Amphidinium_carterae.1
MHENLDIRRQHSGMSEISHSKSKKNNLPPPSLPEDTWHKRSSRGAPIPHHARELQCLRVD